MPTLTLGGAEFGDWDRWAAGLETTQNLGGGAMTGGEVIVDMTSTEPVTGQQQETAAFLADMRLAFPDFGPGFATN